MKRAAIIGMGVIYETHLSVIRQNPGIELVGVCDVKEEKRACAPEGVPFFTDWREMIRTVSPDVVHICLPHYLHVPVSCEAARMGCHVFCEKPVALNTAQAEEFAAFEAAHPEAHIGICLQNRLNRTVEILKDKIDSGAFGAVTGTRGFVPWYRAKEYYEASPWRGTWESAGGGCMINQSVHTLDLLYYLGGEVRDVRAMSGQILDYGIEVEDTVAASLHYANGAMGLFFATIANYRNENVQIAVTLEHGDFLIEDCVLYEITPEGERVRIAEDERLPGEKFYFGASHEKLIGAFYRALEEGTDDYIHVRDALMSIRLIDAVQASQRSGRAEKV